MALDRIVSFDLSGCKSESMSYIIEQVLIRMRTKYVGRCMSVCKSWNCFIASPGFKKAHIAHLAEHENHCRCICVKKGKTYSFIFR